MKIFTTLMVLGISTFSMAQTISTEAPSVSSSGTTVPKNTFQIEASAGITSDEINQQYSIPSTLFRFGITNRIELRLSSGITVDGADFNFWTGQNNPNVVSLNPIQIGAKFQFIKDPNKKTKVALISHAEIPQMDVSSAFAMVNIAVSHQLSDKHSIGYNFGYSSMKEPNYSSYTITKNLNYSLIYCYSVFDKFTLYAEAYSNTSGNTTTPWNDTDLGFDFGAMYLLKDNIQLDYAFGRGINNSMSFHSIGFDILLKQK